jgi:NADPH:quinone reductase-like Zn-dependent oxidoreductase
VIATARNPAVERELRALGADFFIAVDQPRDVLIEKFREAIAEGVDVVLDYLWGTSAEALLASAGAHAADKAAHRLRFINIGSLSGQTLTLPAGSLRSSGVEMLGSGLGSLSVEALVRSVGALMQVCNAVGLKIDAEAVPLHGVEAAWSRATSSRLVFTA